MKSEKCLPFHNDALNNGISYFVDLLMDRRRYGSAYSQQRVLHCTDGGHPGQFVVCQISKREDSQK